MNTRDSGSGIITTWVLSRPMVCRHIHPSLFVPRKLYSMVMVLDLSSTHVHLHRSPYLPIQTEHPTHITSSAILHHVHLHRSPYLPI
jgi:hypothetical protein